MSRFRSSALAALDALPFAVIATVAAFVFGRAGALSPTLVGGIAAVVGTVTLLALATISANRYRRDGRAFYFTRTVVVEGLFSLP